MVLEEHLKGRKDRGLTNNYVVLVRYLSTFKVVTAGGTKRANC